MMAERERNMVNAADSYVAIDLETTGIGAKRERITEIGMVKVENGAVTDTYHTLVNPGRPIPEHITELTGIDDDMVKDAPMIQDVIGEVIAFCGTLPVLGHQIMFDYGFLVQAAVNGKLRFERSRRRKRRTWRRPAPIAMRPRTRPIGPFQTPWQPTSCTRP